MKEARQSSLDYIDGITVHWLIKSIVPATYIYNTFEKYPDKFILNSESTLSMLKLYMYLKKKKLILFIYKNEDERNLTDSWTAAERYLIEYHKVIQFSYRIKISKCMYLSAINKIYNRTLLMLLMVGFTGT